MRHCLQQSLGSIFILLLVLAASCTGKRVGPCDYKESRALGEIVDIVPDEAKPGEFLIKVQFTDTVLNGEPRYLHQLLETETDSAFIIRNSIRLNAKYFASISEIIPGTGDCTPLFISFDSRFSRE